MDSDVQFSNWIKLYSARLVRLAYMYEKDYATAEDRVQDTFVKAYRSLHQLANIDTPFPWLARILINECRTAHRKAWVEVVTSIFPERLALSAEESYLRRSNLEEVRNAVLSLPVKYRLPIVLYYFEELSIQQIAEILNLKLNTVKVHLLRGRERLRKLLKEEELDEHRGKTDGCQTSLL